MSATISWVNSWGCGLNLDGDHLVDRLRFLALATLVELAPADIGRPGQDAVNLSDAPASAVTREDAPGVEMVGDALEERLRVAGQFI
jgi:hypothetical protein